MVALLRELPQAVGFMGRDRYDELDDIEQRQVRFLPVAATTLRFALMTSQEKVVRLTRKLKCLEPVAVASTYPRTAVKTINRVWGLSPNAIEVIYFGGSLESKPTQIERIDGSFDVVDKGETAAQNDQVIVADNLGEVTFGAVWRQGV